MKILIIGLLLIAHTAFADDASAFLEWKGQFSERAIAHGIAEYTVDQAMTDIELLPRVIELGNRQPEFTQTFLQYLSKRVTADKLNTGRLLLEEHQALLETIQAKYGVDTHVLLALWGLETTYGRHLGNLDLPSALATLSFQGRRQQFFEEQLLILLSLFEDNRYITAPLQGSWAGAMGHMQFIPSTLRTFGVDGDEDGFIDLRGSLHDAMASAANYLANIGWKPGEPIAIEVILPTGFDYQQAQLSIRKPAHEWIERGVRPASLQAFPRVTEDTSILSPQGHMGPAFMVFSNFDVIMRWNKSLNYALSVAHLSNRLQGLADLVVQESGEAPTNPADTVRLQEYLLSAGYDAGEPDGIVGSQTQAAIRQYQIRYGMIADGYPSQSLFNHMLEHLAQASGN